MLYFNRNGVWFTIPIAKGAVYDRELLEKQIHTSLLGLQNLKDRSPGLDQMRFEKPGEYVIKSVFGRDDILINPPTIIKGGTKSHPLYTFAEKPVPVYELVSGWHLARFWVGVDNYWANPTIDQEASSTDRYSAEFTETDYEGFIVYPLKRIAINSEDRSSDHWIQDESDWPPNEYDVSEDWSPGLSGHTAIDYFPGGPDAGWYGPTLAGTYWLPNGYCMEWCPANDPDGCYIYGDWPSFCRHNMGNFLVNSPEDLTTWDGSDFADSYFYSWGITSGRYESWPEPYLATFCCPSMHETIIVDDDYTEHDYFPVQTRHDYSSWETTSEFTLNGSSVLSHYSSGYRNIDYTWTASRTQAPDGVGICTTGRSGSYSYLENDCATVFSDSGGISEGWGDYEAWCGVWNVVDYDDQTFTFEFDPDDTSNPDNRFPTGNFSARYNEEVNFTLTWKVIAKVAGSDQEFLIYESPSGEDWEGYGYCSDCEIYDFNGKPVYIIVVYIYPPNYNDPEFFINAMIYDNELFLSTEFYEPDYDAHGSVGRWGLETGYYARAVGVRYPIKITDIIEQEV